MITAQSLIRRDRGILLAGAAGVVALGWFALIRGHPMPQSLAMSTHAHSHGGVASAFLMWVVMMLAMMLPPVMPWILLFAATSRGRDTSAGPYFSTTLFVAGYFTVWAAYCLVAAVSQQLLVRQALLGSGSLKLGPYAGGVLLLLAGLFQWTPLKSACLAHCRSPLGFLLSHWREGSAAAFRMGLRHGLYCVGCCWALMGLSFALGVMNLLWMGALTLFLCVEKIAPAGGVAGRIAGLVFVGWGLGLLLL